MLKPTAAEILAALADLRGVLKALSDEIAALKAQNKILTHNLACRNAEDGP